MAAILVGLNAASYTQRQKDPESEVSPNRSTFNAGPTGTQAFYTLLSETGRKVVRWQEPADALEIKRKSAPGTFVVIGPMRRDFKDAEYASLLRWVSAGGRLVIIDREPPGELAKTTAKWKVSVVPEQNMKQYRTDPSDQRQMIADTPAAKPGQPSLFSFGVNAVQTSQFASAIDFERDVTSRKVLVTTTAPPPPVSVRKTGRVAPVATPTPVPAEDPDTSEDEYYEDEASPPSLLAPVAHLSSKGKVILADVAYGNGRIVFLSDPYVVSNGGVTLVDNAQLAINIVSNGDGLIAFDEYHHGYGGNNNRLLEFFAGTPVVAIFFQCLLIVGLVFLSRSRRFGRALPNDEPDRLSKLEYVAAMAELQQRTRSYDLAIENIYRDFRRRAARLLGVDNMSVWRQQFAVLIAERAKADRNDVDDLMFKCEEIIAGEPTNKRETLELVTRIRKLEQALGLRRRASK